MSDTVYSIYLYNKNGAANTYGFFTSPPEVSLELEKSFSNVWISQKLHDKQSTTATITKNYYAFCGTSPSELQPGVQVAVGMSRLAELGTKDAHGSTFHMYVDGSMPVFEDKVYATAAESCYEIDTSDTFHRSPNYIIGMSAPDPETRMVPVASFEAPPNTNINIKPHGDYYISAFDFSAGTAIDFQEESKAAAHIDFASNPGNYGAIVIHNDQGDWEITYAPTRAVYLTVIGLLEHGGSSALEQKVDHLAEQISCVLRYLPAAAAAEPEFRRVASKKASKVEKKAHRH